MPLYKKYFRNSLPSSQNDSLDTSFSQSMDSCSFKSPNTPEQLQQNAVLPRDSASFKTETKSQTFSKAYMEQALTSLDTYFKKNKMKKKKSDVSSIKRESPIIHRGTMEVSDDVKSMEIMHMNEVGTFVQCDECDKWRYLPHVSDPLELPEKWYCHMNPNVNFNRCSVQEEDNVYDQNLIENKYTAGSVVWAKLGKYPWWPAIVDDDPDTGLFYWLDNEFQVKPSWYHVTFLDMGQQVTRAWIRTKNLIKFQGNNPNRITTKNIYYERIKCGVQQAGDALKLPLTPRLKKYGFLSRYNKPNISSMLNCFL